MPAPEFPESGGGKGWPRNLHRERDGCSSQQGQSEHGDVREWGRVADTGPPRTFVKSSLFTWKSFMTDPVTILLKSMDHSECQSSNLGKGED